MDTWEDFSEDPTLNTGHFMALTFDALPADDYDLHVAFTGGTIETDWDMDHAMTESQRTKILYLDDPSEQTLTLTLTSSVLEEPLVKVFTFDVVTLSPATPVVFNLNTMAAPQEALVMNQLVSALQEDDVLVTPTGLPEDNTADLSGTLKHMMSFSDFSQDPTLQIGNFLALQINWIPEGAEVTIEVKEDGSTYEVLNKDQYDNFVVRITELTSEIVIVLDYENETYEWKFDPTGLILTEAP